MAPSAEHGGSKISAAFWLLVLAAFIYAAVSAGPAYVANYGFRDSLNEVARTPAGRNAEVIVLDKLERAIKEAELKDYLTVTDCKITAEEAFRVVTCDYEREIRFLPGFRRTVRFENRARQPVF
jgi:hypothetical protein